MPDFSKYGNHFSLKPEKLKAIKYFRRISRMAERLYI